MFKKKKTKKKDVIYLFLELHCILYIIWNCFEIFCLFVLATSTPPVVMKYQVNKLAISTVLVIVMVALHSSSHRVEWPSDICVTSVCICVTQCSMQLFYLDLWLVVGLAPSIIRATSSPAAVTVCARISSC